MKRLSKFIYFIFLTILFMSIALSTNAASYTFLAVFVEGNRYKIGNPDYNEESDFIDIYDGETIEATEGERISFGIRNNDGSMTEYGSLIVTYAGETIYNQRENGHNWSSSTVKSGTHLVDMSWSGGSRGVYIKSKPSQTAPTLSIATSSTTARIGSSPQISYYYNGDGAASVSSSNSSVVTASVNPSSKLITLTPIRVGTAVITLSTAETNSYFAASKTLNVTVLDAQIAISTHPQSVALKTGSVATFSVSISSGTNVKYQWYYNDGTENNIISGATSNKYSVTAFQPLNGRKYFCQLSNYSNSTSSLTSVYTNSATLTVYWPHTVSISPLSANISQAVPSATFTVTAHRRKSTILYLSVVQRNSSKRRYNIINIKCHTL